MVLGGPLEIRDAPWGHLDLIVDPSIKLVHIGVVQGTVLPLIWVLLPLWAPTTRAKCPNQIHRGNEEEGEVLVPIGATTMLLQIRAIGDRDQWERLIIPL